MYESERTTGGVMSTTVVYRTVDEKIKLAEVFLKFHVTRTGF